MNTRTYLAASALLLAALGCRDGSESATEPSATNSPLGLAATALSFRQVSGGPLHTCAVTTDHHAYCWGFNWQGQIGDGTPNVTVRPVAVLGGLSFRQVTTGYFHTCGITTDNRAYCWGYNEFGALGDNTTTPRYSPVPVAGGLRFRQVSAGHSHTCGVSIENLVYCWGRNSDGQLGDGTGTDHLVPVAVSGRRRFEEVSAGDVHTCALTTSNVAFCWGKNEFGQLGRSTEVPNRSRPSRVPGARRFRQLEAGKQHTCGVDIRNHAFCWGDGWLGQLGDGQRNLRFRPTAVAGGLSFIRVTAGGEHTCGTTATNQAYCWGALGGNGEIGDGTYHGHLTPVVVIGDLQFGEVSAGGEHTCGTTLTGVAYCWGYNGYGQVGDGTYIAWPYPVPVAAPIE